MSKGAGPSRVNCSSLIGKFTKDLRSVHPQFTDKVLIILYSKDENNLKNGR